MGLFGQSTPKEFVMFFFIVFVTVIVGSFLFLLLKTILTKNNPPSAYDIHKLQITKSLPNITFKCKPKLTDKMLVLIVFATTIILFYTDTILAVIFSSIFGAYYLLLIFGLGEKMISEIEFGAEGILFYSRLFQIFGFAGKFYLPYSNCYLGWMPLQGGIIFFKGKLPYVAISKRRWGKSAKNIIDEIERRLPESHLPT